jgi:Uma2 family endonuclease
MAVEVLVESIGVGLDEWPPTEDDLPYDDGMPMETQRHVLQMYLLLLPLNLHWAGRDDVFVGGNMFVYFSVDQDRRYDFRGPDVFVVQGVTRRERKSWVVWQEGKGPDVVIELLSDSTAERDKTEKKWIYQERLRVPEYFWYDPFSSEWAGFALTEGAYTPIQPTPQGWLVSRQLGLALVRWEGSYQGVEARWLRWATLDGEVLPTPEEVAEREGQRARQAQHQAEQAQQQAAELAALLARYQEHFGELPE